MAVHTLFLIVLLLYSVNGYKMALFVLDVSNSQLLSNKRVAEPLAATGHDVTMILITLQRDQDTTEIEVESSIKIKVVNATTVSQKDDSGKEKEFVYEEMPGYKMIERLRMQMSLLVETCQATLKQKEFLHWLKAEKFDLAFAPMFDVCSVGPIHYAEIPGWIWLNSGSVMDYIAYLTGIPIIPSYVPPMMMDAAATMNFIQRIKCMIGHVMTKIIWTKCVAEPQTKLFRAMISSNFPDLQDLAAKCPLIMANTNNLYEMPRPILAKVIGIGGVGIVNETKALSEALSKRITEIMDAGEGAILFSFGSVALAYKMPIEWKRMFLATFQRFCKYQFLVRYEKDDIIEKVRNVQSYQKRQRSSSLEQCSFFRSPDVLRHPKTKAFITHGGYNSFQEALLTGVPLITIPLFGDQSKNARLAEHHGFSLVLSKGELSEETLYKALKEVLTNSKYSEAAKKLSRMVKYQPVSPAELLVRWSEFVAEFHTLENLEPAGIKLNFIQYYSHDVIGFLFFILLIVILIKNL